jgi:hypothetical protein
MRICAYNLTVRYRSVKKRQCVQHAAWPEGRTGWLPENERLVSVRASVFESETDLDRNLPVLDGTVIDITARFDHFEPVHMLDGFRGLGDRILNGIVTAVFRTARDFNVLVNVICHDYELSVLLTTKDAP